METLGFLQSEGGSGSAPKVFFPRKPDSTIQAGGYSPRSSSTSSVFPYPGGKGHISEWIIDLMPQHDTYVEVFGGAAGILFNKRRSKYEIYNDHNEDLTQFFSILRNREEELAEWLQSVPYSRSQYEEWVAEFYDGVRPDDPIERAGRFFSIRYMQYIGVSSSPNGFKTRAKRSPARTFDNARKRIHSLAQRFREVTVENQGYQAILEKYDDSSVDVLYYLDPPYVGSEGQYGTEFEYPTFVDQLHSVEGDWMMSCSQIPDGLGDYTILERTARHQMKRSSDGVREKVICNFNPNERVPFITDKGT
ncbi:DNA adenine methylase [Natronomonas amylolytica]|uniref:DNA adenine methylase n=1 Tax=Natronomonas amylolytica TaxID=3108498 RepID=UPI003009AAF9